MSNVLYQTTVTSTFSCNYGNPILSYKDPLSITLPMNQTTLNTTPTSYVTIPAFPVYSNTVYASTMRDSITIASDIMMCNYLSNNFVEILLNYYPEIYEYAYNKTYNIINLSTTNTFNTYVVDYDTNSQNISWKPEVGTFPVSKFFPRMYFYGIGNINSPLQTTPPVPTAFANIPNTGTNYGTLNGWVTVNNTLINSELSLLTSISYQIGQNVGTITNTINGFLYSL
jgi:hypothetical protein